MDTLVCIDRKLRCIVKLDLTIFHISDMRDLTTDNLDRIFDYKSAGCCLNHAGISALTTHCCVKWCLFRKDGTFLSF